MLLQCVEKGEYSVLTRLFNLFCCTYYGRALISVKLTSILRSPVHGLRFALQVNCHMLAGVKPFLRFRVLSTPVNVLASGWILAFLV
jgi:hypothetical protein